MKIPNNLREAIQIGLDSIAANKQLPIPEDISDVNLMLAEIRPFLMRVFCDHIDQIDPRDKARLRVLFKVWDDLSEKKEIQGSEGGTIEGTIYEIKDEDV